MPDICMVIDREPIRDDISTGMIQKLFKVRCLPVFARLTLDFLGKLADIKFRVTVVDNYFD